jgi:hypothetical protein
MNPTLSHLVRAAAAGAHLRTRTHFPTTMSLWAHSALAPNSVLVGIQTVKVYWRRRTHGLTLFQIVVVSGIGEKRLATD